eukprot:1085595-Amorphochlora_amoeboformis.AAC.2
MLGSGAFARVYLVKHKKTKVKYAAKSIPKSKLDEDMRKLVDGEIKILKQIKHPNCCNLVPLFAPSPLLIPLPHRSIFCISASPPPPSRSVGKRFNVLLTG